MRTPRTMLATAAATAVLAIGAPGAYAAGSDWSHDDSSYSTEHSGGGSHDGPHGGMHTGGGALSLRNTDSGKDWGSDSGDSSSSGSKDSGWTKDDSKKDDSKKDDSAKDDSTKDDSDKYSGGGDHEKPKGGMHTGGGALSLRNTDSGKDWGSDSGSSKDSGWTKDSGSGEHEKPHGGMHTGGGALAAPSTTAGGVAVLALVGAGLYAARRKKSATGLA